MAEAEATSSQQAPVEWNVGELVSHIRDVATKENTFDNVSRFATPMWRVVLEQDMTPAVSV
jgi:hypothetical protein